jgi:ATP-dependent protease ClpP protease subunit
LNTKSASACVLQQLASFERQRESRAIIYFSGNHGTKTLSAEDSIPLYEFLSQFGHVPRLDLILNVGGGSMSAAYRLALLLRHFTAHLTILVPHQARSAGTLLCLAANEIVMTPVAELSPLDPALISGKPQLGDAKTMAAESVRAFSIMASEWFGIKTEAMRVQCLGILAQHIAPATLAALFRIHDGVKKYAMDLLAYQLTNSPDDVRERIAATLITAFPEHQHGIAINEAKSIGLNVSIASAPLSNVLLSIHRDCQRVLDEHEYTETGFATNAVGIMASAHSFALYRSHQVKVPESKATGSPAYGVRRNWTMCESSQPIEQTA